MNLARDPLQALLQAVLQDHDPAAVGRLRLDRLHSGDLTALEAEELRRRLAADPALAARLDALRAEDARFRERQPWSAVREGILGRVALLPPEPAPGPVSMPLRWWRSLPSFRLAAVAGLGLACLLLVLRPWAGPPESIPTSRTKGDLLAAWARIEGHTEPLEPGQALRAGDALQFRVSTSFDHILLVGVDGTGTLTRYHPALGPTAAPWTPGAGQPLPEALVLDEAPGPEVFLVFLFPEAAPIDNVLRAVAEVAADGGPRALLQADWSAVAPENDVFWVEKEPNPGSARP